MNQTAYCIPYEIYKNCLYVFGALQTSKIIRKIVLDFDIARLYYSIKHGKNDAAVLMNTLIYPTLKAATSLFFPQTQFFQ